MRAEQEYSPTVPPAEDERADGQVPPGNPLRPKSAALALLALTILFLSLAVRKHVPLALPVGVAALVVATAALLDALGTFDDGRAPHASVSLRRLVAPLGALAASCVLLVTGLRLAVAGVMPHPIASAALVCTASCLAMLASGQWVLARLGAGEWPASTSIVFGRHGFWLLAITTVLYVPMLGSFSLFDPWETHYGEVAREMLARDDWISLWWAQEGWFFSKPILNFWLQGLAFSFLGVRFEPDRMLGAVAEGHFPQPEWAARAPVIVLTLLAIYLAYRAVTGAYGARAGFLGGLVLATAPYWYLIAHQSMTDMPYAAPLTGALALFALGLQARADELVRSYELTIGRRSFRLSLAHVLLGAVIATALPQILYLLTRNVSLYVDGPDWGFNVHGDAFFAGSGGGNCGLPGNERCRLESPLIPEFQPALGALLWTIVLGVFLMANRGERRVSRLCYLGAWYLTAVSLLAKGAPGLVLPVVVAIATVCATKRFRDLARLELPGLLMLVLCVALPWYVQAYMRHGSAFTDRLLFHDMYKRAFVHVHDTNVGDDVSFSYYLWQLGYGLFPWTGVAAFGLVSWLRERDEAETHKAAVGAMLALWAVIGFSMFAVSLTKFHHYALPVAPPICLLTGIVLDRVLDRPKPEATRVVLYYLGIGLAALTLVLGASRFEAGNFLGTVVDHAPVPPPSPVLGACLLLSGVAAFGISVWTFRPAAKDTLQGFDSAVLSLMGVIAAGFVALVGRDLYTDTTVDGNARLLHLFVYNYARPWPASLDFSATLRAFTIVATCACALFALPRLRAHGARLLVATSVLFTAFGLNAYLVQAAPHYGQRETLLTYYATRASAEEPIVAFQMNWKGENFYTGNRIPAFVTTGQAFKQWIGAQRERGTRVVYFTTEHTRIATLKSELGPVKSFSVLTRPELNNKFALARVEL